MLLQAEGIDVNAAAYWGETPLLMASANGHQECVKLLLETPGIDLNCTLSERHLKAQNALMLAATKGACLGLQGRGDFVSVVKHLVEANGLDVNAQDANGYTALMLACMQGHADIAAELLASARVDPNVATCTSRCGSSVGVGRTALHWSAYYSTRDGANGEYKESMAAILALLYADNRVDLDALDVDGLTAAQLEQKEDDIHVGVGEEEEIDEDEEGTDDECPEPKKPVTMTRIQAAVIDG